MHSHEEKWKKLYRNNIVEEKKLQCINQFHEYLRNIRHKNQLLFRKKFNSTKPINDFEFSESILNKIQDSIQIDESLSLSEKNDVIDYLNKTLYEEFQKEGTRSCYFQKKKTH